MTFEIITITSERTPDGKTKVFAIAQDETKTEVLISYQNHEYIDLSPKSIGIMLNNRYRSMLDARKNELKTIKIGDIVGGE